MKADAGSLERESDMVLYGVCDCEFDIGPYDSCECSTLLVDLMVCGDEFDMGSDDFVEFLRGDFDLQGDDDYEAEINVREGQDPLGYAQWMGNPLDRPEPASIDRVAPIHTSLSRAFVFEQPS